MNIPLSSPDITALERDAVNEVLCGTALSLGPKVPEFETAIANYVGSRHAVAVNSGTSGLHLCVKAAGIGEGDEVITTPFSFVASANCVLFERARPVFVDIDPSTYNIDVDRIEAAITPRTKAILPVHVFGRPCRMDAIAEIAARRGLAIIEDSCEAIGASYRGRMAGTFGQTGVFAFYPNKQITTGEGGMIVTDDGEIARLCRSWRNQGRADGSGWLQHERLGYNYRLSDINSVLGSAQLKRIDGILDGRSRVAAMYSSKLASSEEFVLPSPASDDASVSWFVYVIRLNDDYDGADRDQVLRTLREEGIGCNNYFPPIHLQPFYRDTFGYKEGDFPVTEHVGHRTIALPFFTQLTEAQIETVVRALRAAAGKLKRPLFSVSAPLAPTSDTNQAQ